MRSLFPHVSTMILLGLLVCHATAAEPSIAEKILESTGIEGGLILHLGCGTGETTVALRADSRYLVHGFDTDAEQIEHAKQRILKQNLIGKVSAEHWEKSSLPLVDNMVNLVVVEDPGPIRPSELTRVLCPGGIAYIRSAHQWTKQVKARPSSIDEWTHYLYDASGNATSRDLRVGPPQNVQWKAEPTFTRHHDTLAGVSAIVSSGGRIFYILDEGPTSLLHISPQWRLIARDAFNGMLLWKRTIPSWENHLRGFRSGPPQLPRRLVAVGEHVYATLGYDAPVVQLNAATGKTVQAYDATEHTDEMLFDEGLLILVTRNRAINSTEKAIRRTSDRANESQSLLVIDSTTGRLLWRKSKAEVASLARMGLASGGNRVVFQCGGEIRCADLRTGIIKWQTTLVKRKPDQKSVKKPSRQAASYHAPTLIVDAEHGVVLAADRGRLTTFALDDGRTLWSSPCLPDFHAPADVFLADGLVWAGLFCTEGRDPKTGRIKRTLDISGLITPGHHPRCYRNKATDRYIISGKRGMEFFDLRDQRHSRNNWTRGGCQYGIMPANGLLFQPPNSCCCYPGVMLHGFYALSAQSGSEKGPPAQRLVAGEAYGSLANRASGRTSSESWPTFRADPTRSGSISTNVSTSLTQAWKTPIGGKLTAPVVASGRIVVCSVETGRVHAMEADRGRPLWSFLADGRIDTPPTLYRNGVFFGTTDGWVYCLRATDGKLVWRSLAAFEDRRMVVDERLESVWPIHGNVLVLNDVAYVSAGRSCYLDGGIRLVGIDIATGHQRYETRVVIPHDQDQSQAFIMAGVRPDVLVTDGKYLYLQHWKFDSRLTRVKGFGRHLMCHSTLSDDTWFYRTFWRLGYGDTTDYPNSYIKHSLRVPFGQMLVFNDHTVCGLQTFFSPRIVGYPGTPGIGCLLFGDTNKPFTPDEKSEPDSDYPPGRVKRFTAPVEHKWTSRLPMQARAMVLTSKALFVAGWLEGDNANDPLTRPPGKHPAGQLWCVSPDSGKSLARYPLASPPRFDGLIAAAGRLYLVGQDGTVSCWK